MRLISWSRNDIEVVADTGSQQQNLFRFGIRRSRPILHSRSVIAMVTLRHCPHAHSQEGQHFLVCNKTGDALLWSRMTRRSNLDGRSTTIMVLGVGAFAHSTTQILKEDGAKVLTYLTRDYGHFGASL